MATIQSARKSSVSAATAEAAGQAEEQETVSVLRNIINMAMAEEILLVILMIIWIVDQGGLK